MKRVAFIVLLSMLLAAQAVAREYKFTRMNRNNSGLSYDGVSRIMQDSRGFIWVGTYKGLNRYDGDKFKVFTKEDLGLPTDFIHAIVEDRDGNLWIGTDNGAACYDYIHDRFEAIDYRSDLGNTIHNKVTNILVDGDGVVWMLVNNQGVFHLDPEERVLREIPYSRFPGVIGFRKILKRSSGDFWMNCYHYNLFHSDSSFNDFSPVDLGDDSDYFISDEIEGLFEGDGDIIYVASTKNGISEVNVAAKSVRRLFCLPDGCELLDTFLESERYFWISTTRGIWHYDLETGESFSLTEDKKDRFTISGSYVNCTFVDRDGGVWAGTKDGGLSYSANYQDSFEKHYSCISGSLDGVLVSGFEYDGTGHLWIGTEQSGLLYHDIASRTTERVCRGLLPNTICSLCYDAPMLWVGTLEGLFRLDTRHGTVRSYGVLRRSSGVNDPRVYLLKKTSDGSLYAGSTLGISQYDIESDSFSDIPQFNGDFMTGMAEDSEGNLWFSSYAKGVYQWRGGSSLSVNYISTDGCGLKDNKICSVFVDSSNTLWAVGFSNGLARFDRSTGKFTVIDKNVLPSLRSDVFFRILEDRQGQLWIASDSGIVQFNPRTFETKTYTTFDGLLDNTLTNSAIQLPDGDMYFGSANGFVSFNPERLYADGELPRVVLTDVYVGDRKAVLDFNPDLAGEIILRPSESSFGFDFSFLGVKIPASARIQCRLEGYEEEWRDIVSHRSVFYYNVRPGTYSLAVRAASLSDDWSAAREPLKIVVKPPFIFSTMGLLLFALAVVMVVVAVVYLTQRSVRRKRAEQEREYRKAKDEEMFQEKMNFFSHVIHEIKTPLTLIRTPLVNVMAKDSLDDEARGDLEVMNNSTGYLTRLVNELLDFVRVEKQGYVLSPEKTDLVERLRSLLFDYQATARDSNIKLNFDPAVAHAFVNADHAALDKILNNLLLNAVKYADTLIDISLRLEGGCVTVSFSNDGGGIPEAFRSEIFKPFVQYKDESKTHATGVGIGLPLSRTLAQMHSGTLELSEDRTRTCFVLTLPLLPETDWPLEQTEPESGVDNEKPVILVADDNRDLREYICTKMQDNYEMLTVSNGYSAKDILHERNIDLLITDISMPGLNGLDLCRSVREDIEISHVPIIILSARASVESKIQAMESGADLYIEKPFDLEYLRSSVRNILDRRILLKKAFSTGLVGTDIDMFGLPKKDEQFFDAFDSLIMDNLSSSELSVDFLAERLNMSQSTLTRKIRKMLNTSPNNYIRAKRLAVAAEMLRDSHGNNISEIGWTVGFSSVSYFAKCFKDQYGKTPSEYAEGS